MRIFILGGGFGGLQAATTLRAELGPEHDITVVDRNPKFVMGLNKPRIMIGQSRVVDVQHDLARLNPKRIQYVDWEVHEIDFEKRRLLVGTQSTEYDYLILALGAALVPDQIPGFTKEIHNVYTPEGAESFYVNLQAVEKGPVVILLSRLPIKCPPAPYEMAMLIRDYLNAAGKSSVPVQIYTPEPHPLPVAGPEIGKMVEKIVTDKGIEIFLNHSIKEILPKDRKLVFENGKSASYELLGAIPPHTVPSVLKKSGLLGESGWLQIDRETCETKIPRVYAIGDVVAIPIGDGKALPKAGLFAELEGDVAARRITSEIQGKKPVATFSAQGTCFMETGIKTAAKITADFFVNPFKITVSQPSEEGRREKDQFEKERIDRWFK